MKKTVGENLKMFRIKKGLSMEEAGKKLAYQLQQYLNMNAIK